VSVKPVAIQAITRRRPSQIAGTLAVVGDNGVVNNIIFNNMGSINIIYTIKTGANKFTK
jgi:filamentous hemagglutinin family protein